MSLFLNLLRKQLMEGDLERHGGRHQRRYGGVGAALLHARQVLGVSLEMELFALGYAARAAQVLADLQSHGGLPDRTTEREAPLCISAVLTLMEARLEHLRRALRGEEDPTHLRAHHNAVDFQEAMEKGEDFCLWGWDFERTSEGREQPNVFRGQPPSAPTST